MALCLLLVRRSRRKRLRECSPDEHQRHDARGDGDERHHQTDDAGHLASLSLLSRPTPRCQLGQGAAGGQQKVPPWTRTGVVPRTTQPGAAGPWYASDSEVSENSQYLLRTMSSLVRTTPRSRPPPSSSVNAPVG